MKGLNRIREKKVSKKRVIDLLEMATEVRFGLSISNIEMLLKVESRQDKSILIRAIDSLYREGRIVKFKGVCRYIGCITTLYRIKELSKRDHQTHTA